MKKGSMLDLITFMVIIMVTVVGLLFGWLLYDEFQEQDAFVDESVWNATYYLDATFSVFDYSFIFAFIGIGVAIIISAFFIRTHPVFMIISLVVLAIVVMISAPISNALEEISADPSLVSYANQIPTTITFVQNLPLIVLVVGIITVIVLYAKGSGGV